MIRSGVILLLFLAPFFCNAQQHSLIYQLRFGSNKYELTAQHKEILSLIYDSLAGKRNYIIYINGHTDNDADSSYNQQLSLKRSLAVKAFLLERGIVDSLLLVQALGEEQPIVANTTPFDKAKNRRVEIIVLFLQEPAIEDIDQGKDTTTRHDCDGDTTVTLKDGYTLTLSKCDWDRNSQCLRIEKKLSYKFTIKENWLKKHIGFKNYRKVVSYEPHYAFYVVSCTDSCFQRPMKLYIPQYRAPTLKTGVKFFQKKNDKNNTTVLKFKKTKLGDSAYYSAEIYCPGVLNCSTDNRCTHLVNLFAKNGISILSYSYYTRNRFSCGDTLVEAKPSTPRRLTDKYTHAFFHTLTILYKGDTITLKDIPIDMFAHGKKKIRTLENEYEKAYFLFIPFKKYYRCGHYKKYKIRAKDLENLTKLQLELE